MEPGQEFTQPKKKKWRKKWNPRMFAYYLASQDLKYVLPVTDNKTIYNEVEGLNCGIPTITKLRTSKEFIDAVEEILGERIKSQYSQEAAFYVYLKKYVNSHMDDEKPPEEPLWILGQLTGKLTKNVPKPKEHKKMTPAQVAMLVHKREQIQAKLDAKLEVGGKPESEGDNGK